MADETAADDLIPLDKLSKYLEVKAKNYTFIQGGGGVKLHDETPEWGLLKLVHAKCSGAATQYAWVGENYFSRHSEFIPVVAGTTAEVAQKISYRFVETQAKLEDACLLKNTALTKKEVTEAFGAFHNILAPTTDANLYLRTLIEQAFEVLDLDMSVLDSRSAAQFAEVERRLAAQGEKHER